MAEKITLKNALANLPQKTDVDSIVAKDASGNPVYIKKSDLAQVVAELMPTATTEKKGLMSSDFYNIGKRTQISLGAKNAGKLVTILSSDVTTYKRICAKVEGFYEGAPFMLMIYSQSADTTTFATAIYKITPKWDRISFYSKVIDGKFKIFARSTGSSGNPCYVQITHYGAESLNEIGEIYDFDDSFTLL